MRDASQELMMAVYGPAMGRLSYLVQAEGSRGVETQVWLVLVQY